MPAAADPELLPPAALATEDLRTGEGLPALRSEPALARLKEGEAYTFTGLGGAMLAREVILTRELMRLLANIPCMLCKLADRRILADPVSDAKVLSIFVVIPALFEDVSEKLALYIYITE